MKQLSVTTIVALAKILLVIVGAIGILFDFVSPAKATVAVVFVGQALSALGLWKAQDAVPPDPQGLERKD